MIPERSFNGGSYKYGFNGKEKDDEVKGNGNSLDFGARIYDSRLGKWMTTDSRTKKYPDLSPYSAFENNPIAILDPGGDTTLYYSMAGSLMHKSVDNLAPVITVISNKKLMEFTLELKASKEKGVADFGKTNQRWRNYGKSVDVNSVRNFYNKNTIPGIDNISETSPTGYYAPGYFNESKGYMYSKDNLLTAGSKAAKGGFAISIDLPAIEPEMGIPVSTIHIHANEGLPGFNYPEVGQYGPSSPYDVRNGKDITVIVGKENIYLHGTEINTISIDKNKLIPGKLDKD